MEPSSGTGRAGVGSGSAEKPLLRASPGSLADGSGSSVAPLPPAVSGRAGCLRVVRVVLAMKVLLAVERVFSLAKEVVGQPSCNCAKRAPVARAANHLASGRCEPAGLNQPVHTGRSPGAYTLLTSHFPWQGSRPRKQR